MKLLWFSHFVPYPPRGGHLQRSFHLIRQASTFSEVSLVAFNQLNESSSVIEEHAKNLRRYCSSVVIWEPPVKWKGLEWWLRLLSSPRPAVPLAARALWSASLETQLRNLVERERFDVVHVDTLELTPYASHLPGKVVLNLHNCESAMMRRRTNQEKGFLRRAFLEGEARALARLERRGYPQFDTVVTVSAHDAAEVQSTEPSAHTHVVENGTDCAYFSPSGDGKPGEVVFAAAYNWYPNANAASYLLTEIWPLVRNLSPQAHLTVAGKQPPATLRRLVEAADRATLAADPADMRPFLGDASVVVCPIREGGGTRLKILDAMAMGKPVVATSIACEGLRVSPGDDILIAEDAAEFARKTQMLLNDLKLRERIGSSARRTVERQYAWEIVGMQLRDAYLCRGECGMRQPGISAAAVRGES